MKQNKKLFWGLLFFLCLILLGCFLVPQIAHAGFHEDLTYSTSSPTAWIFNVWKVMLGIANVIVVAVLLFLAAVNILHLQYDTYQVKKTLPLLIGGAIASNFSILICRMIVDFAQVLTATFADPHDVAFGYMCALSIGGEGNIVLLTAGAALSLITIIFVVLIILVGILIMAFLLWVRKYVIFILTALSPIAFILYAFPPTQGLFKQWWGWFLRWTFMGPIFMMILWVASKIGESNCGGSPQVSIIFAVVGLTVAACAVPFKLGGAVMSAWGNLGQKATGTGKEGYLRKPVDKFVARQKQDMGTYALNKFPLIRKFSGDAQNKEEASEIRRKQALGQAKRLSNEESGGKYSLIRKEGTDEETLSKIQEATYLNAMREGTLNTLSSRTLKKIANVSTKLELKQKYSNIDHQLEEAEKTLNKRIRHKKNNNPQNNFLFCFIILYFIGLIFLLIFYLWS